MSRTTPPDGQNRLALEHSPYLLQHADNPVDWYPWGEEAFEKARREDKPIFLSIGYSTCHWCHVMEHESFQDSTVASLMNEAFVNVKVDREERPDVDNVYMTVCQLMTGSGGWPLTILMTPDRHPFFAATYIPREAKFGRMGMIEFVPTVMEHWRNNRAALLEQAKGITQSLKQYVAGHEQGAALEEAQLIAAQDQLAQQFDESHGGFGNAPKFPTPHNLVFLLRRWKRTGDAHALAMAERTLQAMASGGIYDHVGYGFHRYSTDSRWFAPHFEKMLYDQALLVMAYTEAFQATGRIEYRRIAEQTITYVLRDMADAGGAFHSAEDADSEGIEGKFYLWQADEIRGLLGGDAEWFTDLFGVEEKGNFPAEVAGGNILHFRRPIGDVARERGVTVEALRGEIDRALGTLYENRRERVRPHKDDKVLTDWNGLMIVALAQAGRVFDVSDYTDAARRAAKFVRDHLWEGDRLLHRYRRGEAGIPGTVDDYAFLVWGLTELYETTFEPEYLEWALQLSDGLITHFWDSEGGGLFVAAEDSEELIVRMKEAYDGAIPSGNSVSLLNFVRLARMTGRSDLEDRAVAIGRAFHAEVSRLPGSFAVLLLGLDFALGPSFEVVLVGDPEGGDMGRMRRALAEAYLPHKVVLMKGTRRTAERVCKLAPYVEKYDLIDNKATAYVCRNFACNLPTTDVSEMIQQLSTVPGTPKN